MSSASRRAFSHGLNGTSVVVVGAGVVVVSGHGGRVVGAGVVVVSGQGAGVVVVSGHGAGVVGSGLAWPFSGLAWPFSFVSALPVKATLDSNLGSSPWGSSP
jgi:hypothetical protein